MQKMSKVLKLFVVLVGIAIAASACAGGGNVSVLGKVDKLQQVACKQDTRSGRA